MGWTKFEKTGNRIAIDFSTQKHYLCLKALIAMPEKIQKKDKAQQQQLQFKASDQTMPFKQMAPPPFQLEADPIQREENETQESQQTQQPSGYQLQLPGLGMPGMLPPSLLPPLAPSLMPPGMLNPQDDDFAFMQRLRRRLPGVGSLLSDDATLGLWQVDPLGAPFEDQDGNARHNPDGSPMTHWNQLGPQELEEQMRISRMIAERRHLNLGWDGPFTSQGLGASHQWEDGRSLNMGLMPTFNEDSTLPMGVDGLRFGLDYRF